MILYIDPGTGSMLFSVVISIVAIMYFMVKTLWIKMKYFFFKSDNRVSEKHIKFAIYSEDKRYWLVFAPILYNFEQRKIDVTYFTSSEDDPFFFHEFSHVYGEYIGKGNRAYSRLNLLEADVCLMTTPGLDVYQLKRSKGVSHYSHILHAVDDATSYRMFGLDYFDSVLLSGEYQKKHIRLLEEKRNLKEKELVVVGCPYLDSLQEESLKYPQQQRSSCQTILIAPSWGPSSLLNRFGKNLLDSLVHSGFKIIVRPHPQSRTSEKQMLDDILNTYKDNQNVVWDFDSNNLGSLMNADVLISDFSGIIFDYVFLFNKPVLYVLSDFDSKPYDSFDIEEQPWKFNILPYIGLELIENDFPRLKEKILEACNNQTLKNNVSAAKDIAWNYRGQSGSRVVEFLIQKQQSIINRLLNG